ncbi:MAG TPA: MBL fold metallo-hydrolase, partial [Clostridia bacterium]|nr:MBL fold metallo-hydrolase [Clostridia bacterium]
MVVKTLVENTAVSNRFSTEHGLSLYIETGKYKLLCDLGASGLFLEN